MLLPFPIPIFTIAVYGVVCVFLYLAFTFWRVVAAAFIWPAKSYGQMKFVRVVILGRYLAL